MIINNENNRLSRNRKRKLEQIIKMYDEIEIKSLLNKFKTLKEKKNKNVIRINELEIKLVKIKYANNSNKLQSALKELIKIHVVNKNLHEIKQQISVDYTGEFEMVGKLKVGDQIRQTHIRFRNMDDFEAYISMKDMMLMIAFSLVIFLNSSHLNLM